MVPSLFILMQSYFCKSLLVVQNKTFSQLSSQNFFPRSQSGMPRLWINTVGLGLCLNSQALVSLLRRALKLFLLKSTSLIDENLKTFCTLPLKLRFELSKGIFMYTIMVDSAPSYLEQLFQVSRPRGITITIPRIDQFKSSLTYSLELTA